MNRYNRHIILSEIGQAGQDKLSEARVLVIGAGGLGCPVLQYLAAAGVGTLGIMDFDVVETSNLQRQVLFGASSIGQNKVTAAKMRLEDLNSNITINAYPEKLTFRNAVDLFNQYDIIVDGTDNFETRYLINDAAVLTGKPLVFAAIYKFQGQVSVFNYNNGPTYRCAFPKKPGRNAVPNCSEVGVLGVLPGIIGTLQANEVLKLILRIGEVLSGKLYFYDALTNLSTTLVVKRNDDEIQKFLTSRNECNNRSLETGCKVPSAEVSIKDIFHREDVQLVDVRELHEQPRVEDQRVVEIPLNQLEQNIDRISEDKVKAVFCQSGIRSREAISLLQAYNIYNCYNMKETALEIDRHIKESSKQLTND